MALINCPECNNRISDKAEKCPHCGLPSRFFTFEMPKEETITVDITNNIN
ncbi:MAG: zinc ribbon domain-containing protein, partial [Clostridiaceae bacterium]|nr:zinc ribbon domain-containing protein [Clostridiaceae bacterium]